MQAPPPSRAAGRVTSANHLSLARAHLLHRSSLFVLSFIFCFYIFCLYQQGRLGYPNRVVFGAKFTSVRKRIEMETWRRVYLRSFLETGGTISELKNGIIDSLCWGVRERFFINPPSLLTATRRVLNAAIPRRKTLLFAFLCKYERNANTWKCPLSSFGHQWDFVNINFGFINRVDFILIAYF